MRWAAVRCYNCSTVEPLATRQAPARLLVDLRNRQQPPLGEWRFSLGSNVLKDKIWNSQAQNAGACAKVEGCVRAWFQILCRGRMY
jgi:hypothetical protein